MGIRRTHLIRLGYAKLNSVLRREDGASAVEFSLIAPVLILMTLTMVDVGLAISERMTLDHIVRAGAQRAMADPGEEDVRDIIEDTAEQQDYVLPSDDPDVIVTNPLSVAVDRYCACPESRSESVDCSTACPGPAPTFVFYRMSTGKDFEGIVIPEIALSRSMEVQVR